MYLEAMSWQREPLLAYITEECGLLDCSTAEEMERVGNFVTSHMCSDSNMQRLGEMIASYSKPQCEMHDFAAWIITELSNHCVKRMYFYRDDEEE